MTLAPVLQFPVLQPVESPLSRFHTHLERSPLASLTKITYGPAVNAYAAWLTDYHGGDEAYLDRVGAEAAATDYKRYLLDIGRAPATVNKVLAAIELMYEVGCGFDITVKHVRIPKPGEPDALSEQEARRLKREAARAAELSPVWGVRDVAIVELLLGTGARLEEAARLELADIPLTARKGQVRLLGKGDQVREVKVPTEARDAVKAWLRVRSTLPQAADTQRLWLGRSPRGPFGRKGIQIMLAKLGDRARIDHLSPHDLRHTFALRLANAGVPLPTIQRLLGHANIETTARYTRTGQADADAAIDQVFG